MGGISSTFSACRSPGEVCPARGFALLLTVVLLALLVLLLTALAAMARVETQVVFRQEQLAQARQNALFGLHVALGQLQRYTGPDARITAQAALLGEGVENPWFTGVWEAGTAGAEPMTWLVSGNEDAPRRIGPDTPLGREAAQPEVPLVLTPDGVARNGPEADEPNCVRLVGPGSASLNGEGARNGAVVVPGVPLTATVPGQARPRVVGRYAFWVGDQGVKASLALPDRSAAVTHGPWDTERQRERLRQQVLQAPAYFRNVASERAGFDPLLAGNASALDRIVSDDQLRWLQPVAGGEPLAPTLRQGFHAFTGTAFSLLANTRTDALRGLMSDLSRRPEELGPAFVARADLSAYMETPSAENTAVPAITSVASPRRRYRIRPPVTSPAAGGLPAIEFGVAPVLTDFVLQFRVLRSGEGRVSVRSRLYVALWNPYTSALVPPDDLTLEIEGLPSLQVSGESGATSIDLQRVRASLEGEGGAMRVRLPFEVSADSDRASWLPGRLYGWVTPSGASPGTDLDFYDKNISRTGWSYPAVTLAGTDDALRVECDRDVSLTVRLRQGGQLLATYHSPRYAGFVIPTVELVDAGNWVFAYAFRLRQPSTTNTDRSWLTTTAHDPRRSEALETQMGDFNARIGVDPESYTGTVSTAEGVEDYLLLRPQGRSLNARSAANDVPLFELPRLPPLSVGELQHLCLPAQRPFAIGNPWGGEANAVFDRFFFSGLAPEHAAADLAQGEPLPNWHLRVVDTPERAAADDPWSSRFLLQAGGFNVNTTQAAAWRAVLSGRRFHAERPFAYAAIDHGSGGKAGAYTGSQVAAGVTEGTTVFGDATLDDTARGAAPGPSFSRFPQSAQETYDSPDDAEIDSLLAKHVYRCGVRGGSHAASDPRRLTTDDVIALSEQVAHLLRKRAASHGPYRSLEEFLSPDAALDGRSLLEAAIEEAGLNPPAIRPLAEVSSPTDYGLSSLTLTQADILTALAPFLRTRSDTFLIRSFGEALNPATGAPAGKAWCEATVQRFPEPLEPGDDAAQPARPFGRHYRIVSFRWLSPADL